MDICLLLLVFVNLRLCSSTALIYQGKDEKQIELRHALDSVPDFIKEYHSWHAKQRKEHLYDPSTKFLTLACKSNSRCGGISDLLRSVPFFLWMASKTNRVLLIKWEKFDLEDFLLPPDGGIDWRVPEGMTIGSLTPELQVIGKVNRAPIYKKMLAVMNEGALNNVKNLVIRNGQSYYLKNHKVFETKEKPYGTFSDIWKLLFTPAPALNKVIHQTMKELGLVPKQYVAAHYRVTDVIFTPGDGFQSPKEHDLSDEKKNIIHRAIDCAVAASEDKSLPVYFTSSATKYVNYVLHSSPYAKKRHPVNVVGVDNIVRLHSDFPIRHYNFTEESASDLYPAFVDLYLMGYSKCVSYGYLTFGRLGGQIAGEECLVNYLRAFNKCKGKY